MEIRLAKKEDAEKYLYFLKQLDAETSYMLFEKHERETDIKQQAVMLERMMNSCDEKMFIAEIDHKIVGFIVLFRKPFHKVRHCFQLVIGILKCAQGKNIAFELYKNAENWAIGQGAKRIEFTVVSENLRAIAFYQKLGFEQEGIRKKSMQIGGKWTDEWYMGKLIE